jgi:chromosome partitioning protein
MVIDIGANSENGASYAVRAADFVVIPTSPRLWDINGVPDIARKAKEYNKPYCILINRVLRGPYRAEAERVLEAWNYPICPIALHERVAFANCITSGNAAMEVEPDSTASREFISFYDWLDQQTSAQASPDPGIPQQEVTVG